MTGSQQGATLQCQADHTFSDLAIHATVSLAVSTGFIFLSLQFYPTLQTASHSSMKSLTALCHTPITSAVKLDSCIQSIYAMADMKSM